MKDLPPSSVLAVDDEPANLQLLRNIVERDGSVRLHAVEDPRLALDTFRAVQPDLVLLDINMPHLDGFQVMSQLLATIPDDTYVPIVTMTANLDPEVRRRALAMGAHDFVSKPFDPIEVRLRVRNFLRTRQLHTQLAHQKGTLEARVAERTRDLQDANERLLALDRMKTDFLALVSHEMRTPLTVINGFAELLGLRWDDLHPSQREPQVAAMRRNIGRLETMVDNLLLAAQLEGPEGDALDDATRAMSTVEIGAVVEEAVADSGIDPADVESSCGEEVTAVVAVEPLRHVLTNLLVNASKYGRPPIVVRCTVDDEVLGITVRDHGAGVPDEFADRLFERFAQASVGDRRTATGSGLGLWIARRLARRHGGDLVHEPADPGARFRLTMPTEA